MERGQQCFFYLGQIRLLMPARSPEFPCCWGAAISLHRGASIERKNEKERKKERKRERRTDRKTESGAEGKEGRAGAARRGRDSR